MVAHKARLLEQGARVRRAKGLAGELARAQAENVSLRARLVEHALGRGVAVIPADAGEADERAHGRAADRGRGIERKLEAA